MPVPSIRIFKNAIRQLKGSVVGKNLYSGDRPVATRFFLTYQDVVHDWFAGSLYDEGSKYSNELMVWKILEYASMNGYRFFNFGGAGHPDKPYGPRDFKKRFGGKLVNYGKYVKIKNDRFFKFFKKLAIIKYSGIEAQI